MKDIPSLHGEIRLKGTPVSGGIVIGILVFLSPPDEMCFSERLLSKEETEKEISRYHKALSSSREDLSKLQIALLHEKSLEANSIIEAQIEMTRDPFLTSEMENQIRAVGKNAETVFAAVVHQYEKRFPTDDPIFQERLTDVKDLSSRVLRHLCPAKKIEIVPLVPNAVIFAIQLTPSDIISLQMQQVSGVLTQKGGGKTSHIALIAQAKGTPYVTNIDIEMLKVRNGQQVIVDGEGGNVIVNPSHLTLGEYYKIQHQLLLRYQGLEREKYRPLETIDGYPIEVLANVNSLDEIDLAAHYLATEIGLFRSEYLFLRDKGLFFDEETQLGTYRGLIARAKHLPIVIRVIDIGGDKPADLFRDLSMKNPFISRDRGIRFLMQNKEIFKTQLRAILRASVDGEIRLLIPFISDIHEIREVFHLIGEVQEDLISKGIPFRRKIPLGSMLELPSAMMMCDTLAQECDFLSIGTNDLIQYTMGLDRTLNGDEEPNTVHPSILKMIRTALLEGRRYQKPITLCGEIASNPFFIPLLVGLGVQRFSCAPHALPIIMASIRKCSLVEAGRLAEEALQMPTSRDVSQFLISRTKSFS